MNSPAADAHTASQPAIEVHDRHRAFRRLGFSLVAVLAGVWLANRAIDAWSSREEQRTLFILTQRQQAADAARSVAQFMKNIESQMQWLLQLPAHAGTPVEWYFESVRLLRQVPAITEIARIDAEGREQVRVSRITVDIVGGQADLSGDPKFVQAMTAKRYSSPVYFRGGSEPYMTLAMAGIREDYGVVVAEVNLKFMWDVVSDIKPALQGMIFVVDNEGRLIAHPDISLVLRNTDLSHLAYVRLAVARSAASVGDMALGHVSGDKNPLAMYAPIPSFGWTLILCQSKSPGKHSIPPFCVPTNRVPI